MIHPLSLSESEIAAASRAAAVRDYSRSHQALIFDCDGTLTDSMPLHYRAWFETLQRYGIDFPEDRFYAMGGVPTEKIIRILSGEQRVEVDIARVAAEKEAAFLLTIDRLLPNRPVCEIAEMHFGKLPMAVASGGIRAVVVDQLMKIGVHGLFRTVVAAEDTAAHKPEPDVFLEAARRLEVPPAACIVFEDTDIGLLAARRAGMACVDVREF